MSSRHRLQRWMCAQSLGPLAHLHPAITAWIPASIKGESSRQGASNREREGVVSLQGGASPSPHSPRLKSGQWEELSCPLTATPPH